MNKLTKEKRDRLALIVVAASLIVLALYFFVITPQRDQIQQQEDKIAQSRESLDKNERWLQLAASVRANLSSHRDQLEVRESDMAPLDKFKWFYNTLDEFRSHHDVSLTDITREPEFGEIGVLPKFPYQAAIFGVKLSAAYHDFGKFLANFENQFPYLRVQNLRIELDPAQKLAGTNNVTTTGAGSAESERLAITMKVVTMVKPANSL